MELVLQVKAGVPDRGEPELGPPRYSACVYETLADLLNTMTSFTGRNELSPALFERKPSLALLPFFRRERVTNIGH